MTICRVARNTMPRNGGESQTAPQPGQTQARRSAGTIAWLGAGPVTVARVSGATEVTLSGGCKSLVSFFLDLRSLRIPNGRTTGRRRSSLLAEFFWFLDFVHAARKYSRSAANRDSFTQPCAETSTTSCSFGELSFDAVDEPRSVPRDSRQNSRGPP